MKITVSLASPIPSVDPQSLVKFAIKKVSEVKNPDGT